MKFMIWPEGGELDDARCIEAPNLTLAADRYAADRLAEGLDEPAPYNVVVSDEQARRWLVPIELVYRFVAQTATELDLEPRRTMTRLTSEREAEIRAEVTVYQRMAPVYVYAMARDLIAEIDALRVECDAAKHLAAELADLLETTKRERDEARAALDESEARTAALLRAASAYADHHGPSVDHHRDDCPRPGDCEGCEIDRDLDDALVDDGHAVGGALLAELNDLRQHRAEHCRAVDRAEESRNEVAAEANRLRTTVADLDAGMRTIVRAFGDFDVATRDLVRRSGLPWPDALTEARQRFYEELRAALLGMPAADAAAVDRAWAERSEKR